MSKKYDEEFLNVAQEKGFSTEEKEELYSIVEEILNHELWNQMRLYIHHKRSRSIHMLRVCFDSFHLAKKHKLDTKSIAIGALMHDFFLYDWKDPSHYSEKPTKIKEMHAFTHPVKSLENLKKYFPHLVNEKIENIILSHMWPLSNYNPKYKESWIVVMCDKIDSLEVFKDPRELPKYIGIHKKK